MTCRQAWLDDEAYARDPEERTEGARYERGTLNADKGRMQQSLGMRLNRKVSPGELAVSSACQRDVRAPGSRTSAR